MSPGKRSRPAGNGPANESLNDDTASIRRASDRARRHAEALAALRRAERSRARFVTVSYRGRRG